MRPYSRRRTPTINGTWQGTRLRIISGCGEPSLLPLSSSLPHWRGPITFRQRAQPSLAGYGSRPQGLSSARAVLMSSSVPFVFQPVRLTDCVSGEKLLMADGAMAALFPAQLVRRNSSSIGFRPRPPPGHHPHHEIRGPVRSATAVIGAGISAREDLPPLCGPLDRVVEVVGRPRLTRLRRLPEARCRAVRHRYRAALKQLSHGLPPVVERTD